MYDSVKCAILKKHNEIRDTIADGMCGNQPGGKIGHLVRYW